MNESAVYQRKPGLMTASMAGSTVMMDIETGKYYNLGQTGGRIWELLETPMSAAALKEALLLEYNVSEAECRDSLAVFLKDLTEKGLLTRL